MIYFTVHHEYKGFDMMRGMDIDFTVDSIIEGLILPFNKPYNWTSFDLVNHIRQTLCKYTGIKKIKVGHAGTLDPLATGLLIICIGGATKKISLIQDMPKTYEAEITIGATTPSFDLETEIDKTFPFEHVDKEFISQKLELFIGKLQQEPPIFSAKKFNGKRAYEFARQGIDKKMKSSEIEIFSIEMIHFLRPVIKLRMTCSKGTYIRSIARDLGIMLKSGAHLSNLKRTGIGDYSLTTAWDLEKFKRKLNFV
jgi:tRNA pseudouridine55 synthase